MSTQHEVKPIIPDIGERVEYSEEECFEGKEECDLEYSNEEDLLENEGESQEFDDNDDEQEISNYKADKNDFDNEIMNQIRSIE